MSKVIPSSSSPERIEGAPERNQALVAIVRLLARMAARELIESANRSADTDRPSQEISKSRGSANCCTTANSYGEIGAVRHHRSKKDRKMDAPDVRRQGRLKSGNPSGPQFGPDWPGRRCGAHTRAKGECRNPAMKNGRCRMHGGASTGPRTPEGKNRAAMARLKHGQRSRRSNVAEICGFVRGAIQASRAFHALPDPSKSKRRRKK